MNYLSNYQTFTNKHELNEAVALHLSHNHFALNSTEKAVLSFLSRYSVKYAGVSHLKHETIADKLNKSTRTIQRSIKRLEELHIVKKQSFYRKVTGGYGANLYIILPFNSSSVVSSMSHRPHENNSTPATSDYTKSENEPYSFYKQNNIVNNTYVEKPMSYYNRFRSVIESFIGEGNQKLINRLFGIYKAQSHQIVKFDSLKEQSELIDVLALKSITITMQATKKKSIKSLTGYFNGTLKRIIDKSMYELENLEPTENFAKTPSFGYSNSEGNFVIL